MDGWIFTGLIFKVWVTLSACLPLPPLVVLLVVRISLSRERGLLYGSDTLEPTPYFDMIHFLNWWAKSSASFRSLKTLWVSRTGNTSDWCALQEALYACIDTIQYISYLHRSWLLYSFRCISVHFLIASVITFPRLLFPASKVSVRWLRKVDAIALGSPDSWV